MEDQRSRSADEEEIKRLRTLRQVNSQASLAEAAGVSVDTVKRAETGKKLRLGNLKKIAGALGVTVEQIIRRTGGERADASPLAIVGALHPRIEKFLSRNRLPRAIAIDEFIQLETSPGWRGWRENQVSIFRNVHSYEPPPDFEQFLIQFPPEAGKPINKLYSLHSYSSSEDTDDAMRIGEEPGLIIQASGGTWAHVVALSGLWNAINENPPDRNGLRFRDQIEDHILRIRTATSELFANVNAEVIVVTKDSKIVLTRRPDRKDQLAHGRWSASLEEQMMREKDDESKATDDGRIFYAAHRGATSELGVTIVEEATRLLSFGCEFANFTAAFLFVVYCREDFDTVLDKWPFADDKKEAVAIDCLDERDIPDALASDCWRPTPRAIVSSWSKDPTALSVDRWHPTAKARLMAYLHHRKALAKTSRDD